MPEDAGVQHASHQNVTAFSQEEKIDTLDQIRTKVASYMKKNELDLAIREQLILIEKSKQVNGLQHQQTLQAMSNLSSLYLWHSRYRDALKVQEEILKVVESAGREGSGVTDQLIILSNMMESMVQLQGTALSHADPTTFRDQTATGEYLVTLQDMKLMDERLTAEGLLDMAVPWRERHFLLNSRLFGFLHRGTIESLARLCWLLGKGRNFEEEHRVLQVFFKGCQAERPPREEESHRSEQAQIISEAMTALREYFNSQYWSSATESQEAGPSRASSSPGGVTESEFWARVQQALMGIGADWEEEESEKALLGDWKPREYNNRFFTSDC